MRCGRVTERRETIYWACCCLTPRSLRFPAQSWRQHRVEEPGAARRDCCSPGKHLIGRRRAEVDAARAARNTANAEAELTRLDVAIGAVNAYLTLLAADAVIQKTAHENEACRRLVAIPGIGPVTATALIAAIGNGGAFHKGREFAAWMGVVPREHSTGGQQKLLGISKRGNSYLRRLFVQGARAVLQQRTKQSSGLSTWLAQLTSRTHRNVAAVALANKLARIAWAVLA